MFRHFGKIAEIRPEIPDTWQDRIFLTFDIDWACDAVLADAIDLVEAAGVPATWFVTHSTPLLVRLRANDKFELGIHPNFNFLLEGDPRNGANAAEVVDRMLELVPQARSVRSHSMTQSSRLLQLFKDRKLTHDANHFIPEHSGIELRPWLHWNGLIKVPYCWEDDAHCMHDQYSDVESMSKRSGIRVLDFHPIHVYLNTERMERYESTRSIHHLPEKLLAHRSAHHQGAREVLKSLLKTTPCESQ